MAFAQEPAPATPVEAPAPPMPPPPPGPPQPYAPAPAYPPGYGPYLAAPALPGAHTHDGVFVRLLLGPGYTSMSADAGGTNTTFSGGGLGFAVAVGGALSRNVVLFGELVESLSLHPDLKIGNASTSADNANSGGVGIGPGIAYYTDDNLYLSGTLLFARGVITIDNSDRSYGTDYGVGVNALVGKEWWVSDNWGLGAALQLFAAAVPDRDELSGTKPTWKIFGLNVLFSASFN